MAKNSLWATITSAWNRITAPPQKRHSQVAMVEAQGVPDVKYGPESLFDRYINAYTYNPWITGAIKARCDAAASATMRAYTVEYKKNTTTKDVEEIRRKARVRPGSITAALETPNPMMTQYELIWWTCAFYLLDGNAYWVYEPKFNEIWPMAPQRVTILTDNVGMPRAYEYEVQGIIRTFDAAHVIHFKNFNPHNMYYGMSDIMSLQRDLDIDRKTKKFVDGFFERGARFSGIIEVEDDIDPAEQKRIEKEFNFKHGSSDRMHSIAFLAAGMKFVADGVTNKDMQLPELSLLSRDSIMAIYRVPPALLGRWEQARFSNAREQVRLFFEGVQFPYWRCMSSKATAHPLFKRSNLIVDFDTTDIPQLRESDTDKAERGRLLIQSGQMTINEVREKLWRLSPRPEGEALILPKSGRNENAGANDPKADGDNKDPIKPEEMSDAEDDTADEQPAGRGYTAWNHL